MPEPIYAAPLTPAEPEPINNARRMWRISGNELWRYRQQRGKDFEETGKVLRRVTARLWLYEGEVFALRKLVRLLFMLLELRLIGRKRTPPAPPREETSDAD